MRYANRKLFVLAAVMLLASLLINASVNAAAPSHQNVAPISSGKISNAPAPAATSTPGAGCWNEATAYPIPIAGNGAVGLAGFIYSFGGNTATQPITASYKYDGNTWTPIASLPLPLDYVFAATDGTYVYLLGGFGSPQQPNTWLRYNPASDTYSQLATPPHYSYDNPIVYLSGTIYRIGGITYVNQGGYQITGNVDAYNITTDSWSAVADYPLAVMGSAVAAIGGYLYVAGGAGGAIFNNTFRYDPATNIWDDSAIADLPDNRALAASGLLDGDWIVAGGDKSGLVYDSVLAWDPATNTWNDESPMVEARYEAAGSSLGGNFYIIGGAVGSSGTTNTQRYSPNCDGVTPTPTEPPFCGFAPPAAYLGDTGPNVAVADFNGDGKPDLAAIDSGSLNILLGNGDGSFGSPTTYRIGSILSNIVTAHFNADSNPDLAIVDGGNVDLLLENGDGTFQQPLVYFIGNVGLAALAVDDFNHDGNSDLVVGGGTSLWLLLGNGDGSLRPPVSLGQFQSVYDVIATDLNRDGKLDLALVGNPTNSVSVLLGNGDGSFQSTLDYPTPPASYIASGDLNHDGNLDLITAGVSGGTVSVLLGNGDGTFQPSHEYFAGYNPGKLSVADFNGDGNLDVALPYSDVGDSGYVVILFGSGDGALRRSNTTYITASYTNGLVPADLDGNGSPDLAVTGYALSVLLNNCNRPPTPTATGTPPTATPTRTPQPTVCPNPFVDINGNVFFHAINALYCDGVINGSDATHYSPAGTASRAEFAKIVVLALSVPLTTPASGQSFTDVPPSFFAYVYIESGYAAGILSGFDAQGCASVNAQYPCYLPRAHITRGQLTKLVVNAAHFTLMTPTGGPSFTDVPPSNIFYAYIETAYAHHVVNGYLDGTFRPNNNIRRDEMAQIVYTSQLAYGTPTPRPTDTPMVTGTPPNDTPMPTARH